MHQFISMRVSSHVQYKHTAHKTTPCCCLTCFPAVIACFATFPVTTFEVNYNYPRSTTQGRCCRCCCCCCRCSDVGFNVNTEISLTSKSTKLNKSQRRAVMCPRQGGFTPRTVRVPLKNPLKSPKLSSSLPLAYRPPCLAAVTDASRQPPRGNEHSEPLREEKVTS